VSFSDATADVVRLGVLERQSGLPGVLLLIAREACLGEQVLTQTDLGMGMAIWRAC